VTFDPDKLRQKLIGDSTDDESDTGSPESPETEQPETPDSQESLPRNERTDEHPVTGEPEPKPELETLSVPEKPQAEKTPEITGEPVSSPDQEAHNHSKEPTITSSQTGFEGRDKTEPERKSVFDRIEHKAIKKTAPEHPEPGIKKVQPKSAPESERKAPEAPEAPEDNFAPIRDLLTHGSAEIITPSRQIPEPESDAGESGEPDKTKTGLKKKKGRIKARVKPKEIQSPSPLTILMLFGGIIALIGASVALGLGHTDTPVSALGGIGVLLIGIFALINRTWLRLILTARSVKYGANVTMVIISLLGIMVFVNIISYRYYYRLDLSAEGHNTLSQQSLSVLSDINRAGETITVTAFTQADSGYREVIESLMNLYLYKTSCIKFSFVDPDIQRDLAESKGIQRYPSILFELGNKRSVISDVSEPHYTSALLAVRQTHSRLVSFLSGHGEPNPFSDDDDLTGLSEFKTQLELEGYEVNLLNIPAENGVPPETSLLVIAAPERALTAWELGEVEAFLDNGGSLMCLLEPGKHGGLNNLLIAYGIILNDDIVLDDDNNAFGEITSLLVTGNYMHPIMEKLSTGSDLLFLNAGSLSFTPSRLPGVNTESLARSSGSSWSAAGNVLEFDEDVNTRNAYDLAVIATRQLGQGVVPPDESRAVPGTETEPTETSESTESTENLAQVLVAGDTSFALNANIDSSYNKDFVMNAVNFLTSREDLISIRPNLREDRPLDLSRIQQGIIFAVSVILTPLLVAMVGGLVWWKRH
jgi:ABC-type uncharacterized transport system involved in gliding motility auxiliary subunit